jgi:hypothetical protein
MIKEPIVRITFDLIVDLDSFTDIYETVDLRVKLGIKGILREHTGQELSYTIDAGLSNHKLYYNPVPVPVTGELMLDDVLQVPYFNLTRSEGLVVFLAHGGNQFYEGKFKVTEKDKVLSLEIIAQSSKYGIKATSLNNTQISF